MTAPAVSCSTSQCCASVMPEPRRRTRGPAASAKRVLHAVAVVGEELRTPAAASSANGCQLVAPRARLVIEARRQHLAQPGALTLAADVSRRRSTQSWVGSVFGIATTAVIPAERRSPRRPVSIVSASSLARAHAGVYVQVDEARRQRESPVSLDDLVTVSGIPLVRRPRLKYLPSATSTSALDARRFGSTTRAAA